MVLIHDKAPKTKDVIQGVDSNMVLDIEEYQNWFQAIRTDDDTTVQNILNEAEEKERLRLLNCPFDYQDSTLNHQYKGQCYQVHMPLSVAVCAGAMKVASVLLNAGVDPAQQDCDGNTVIHKLILTIFYHPEQEDDIMKNFNAFLKFMKEDQLTSVFHIDNRFGLRPLEFAVQHGVLAMFLAIMEIPGVYRYKQQTKGLVTYTYYDVTEYEGHHEGSRRHLSPLWLLTFMDRASMGSKAHWRLIEKNYMQQWCRNNFRNNLPFIVVWFFVRLFYISCYFVAEMDTSFYKDYIPGNSTNHCRPENGVVLEPETQSGLAIYLIVHASVIVVVDVIEGIMSRSKRQWPLWYTVREKKASVAQFAVYRGSNLIFAIFIIVRFTFKFIEMSDVAMYWLDIFRMVCPVLSIWNLLFFIQLLPSIGHFVIGVQQIIIDMGHFVIIYAIMFIPFVIAFQTNINTKTNVGCIDGFTNTFDSIYSLFTVMLNMIDLQSLDIRNIEILLVGHIMFTFLISIMMINFFIAILSNTVSFMEQRRRTAIARQRSVVGFMIQTRLQWLFGSYYRRCHHFERCDGKVLLVDVKYDTCKNVNTTAKRHACYVPNNVQHDEILHSAVNKSRETVWQCKNYG